MSKLAAAVALAIVLGLPNPAGAAQTETRYHWTLRTEWYLNKLAWKERVREEAQERRKAAAAAQPDMDGGIPVASTMDPITGCLSAAQVATYARAAGFPESVISTMVAIAYRESHWCPGAVNSSSGACGLWQLYPCPGDQYLNPATNAAGAFAKYQASGLAPWGY